MLIVCSHCTTRLQLQDAKVPARPFTIRCPKCQNLINGQPPSSGATDAGANANNQGAFAVGDAPALEHHRIKATPAPAFKLNSSAVEAEIEADTASAVSADTGDVAEVLAALLQRAATVAPSLEGSRAAARLAWERRLVLVCVTPANRDDVASSLAENNYQVYVASDTTQAIERMREERMDIIILDPEFDAVEQGWAFITSQVNAMRPAERRRLFFVHLTNTARTLDSHAAFVSNINLVVNPADIEDLPRILERAIRDFNDLYVDFNSALNVAAI